MINLVPETMNTNLKKFIDGLPKAELHVHIEGTMEPEQLMLFAERNKISIPYKTVEEAHRAYQFSDFNTFIAAYFEATKVLVTEQDLYDLTLAYLKKASSQGVVHSEIFFDLEGYLERGIKADTVIMGIHHALCDGEKLWGISAAMILCFVRDFDQKSAFEVLNLSLPFKKYIVGVGLASTEVDNPPSKFSEVFAQARSYGYHCVAHAGECCGAMMVREAIVDLHVERIDHGIRAWENSSVVEELVRKKIPLTVCPLSNLELGIVKSLKQHPLKKLLDAGVIVTINSDDPAFFKAYIAENFLVAVTEIGLTVDDIVHCARNSFHASFIADTRKNEYVTMLDAYVSNVKST